MPKNGRANQKRNGEGVFEGVLPVSIYHKHIAPAFRSIRA